MSISDTGLFEELRKIVSDDSARIEKLQRVAALIRNTGSYRWVGLYNVDQQAGEVVNLVWDGPGAPEYPTFAIGKGLTGAAIRQRKVINVGDVASDPRYLTAFGSTRSEIIVPIFDANRVKIVGTIDVESERANAFEHREPVDRLRRRNGAVVGRELAVGDRWSVPRLRGRGEQGNIVTRTACLSAPYW